MESSEHQMEDPIVVFVTAPSQDVAVDLVRAVVGAGLAACGNIMPGIRSIYRWKGEVCDEPEVLIILKSSAARFSLLCDCVVTHHPYECPEVISLPVTAGFPPYLAWMHEQVNAHNA